jgi:hypothetical protein
VAVAVLSLIQRVCDFLPHVNMFFNYEFLDRSCHQLSGSSKEEQKMQEGKSRLVQAVRAVRRQIHADVKALLADETKTYQQVADTVGCSLATVQRLAQMDGISRPVGPRPKSATTEVSNGNE